MTDDETACVCVVDDDDAVRESTGALLEVEGYDVHLLSSVNALFDQAPDSPVGCLLLDYRMPEIDGMTALPMILDRYPALKVVMITAHGDVRLAVRAMRLGAFDFLEKPWTREIFLETVQRAVHASRMEAHSVEMKLNAKAKVCALTTREREVFDQLITGAPNKVIAHTLGLSSRTVEFHRARVLEKMNVRSVAELVRIKARAEGW